MCGLRDNPVGNKPVKKCGKLSDVQGRRTTTDKKRKNNRNRYAKLMS